MANKYAAPVTITGGLLAAGAVAVFAISQSVAASSAAIEPDFQIVAASDSSPVAVPDPTLQRTELPPIPEVAVPSSPMAVPAAPNSPVAEVAPAQPQPETPAQKPAKQAAEGKPAVNTPAAQPPVNTPTPQPTQSPAQQITREQASALVTKQSAGTVLSAQQETRDGVDAWRVTIERSDRSVISGFVDMSSGTVFAWVVDKPAPAATVNTSAAPTQQAGEYEGEEEHEEEEYENENEHEGDDDDD